MRGSRVGVTGLVRIKSPTPAGRFASNERVRSGDGNETQKNRQHANRASFQSVYITRFKPASAVQNTDRERARIARASRERLRYLSSTALLVARSLKACPWPATRCSLAAAPRSQPRVPPATPSFGCRKARPARQRGRHAHRSNDFHVDATENRA